jgi:hypothetical protein
MKFSVGLIVSVFFFTQIAAQQTPYPQNYFRHPLNIPMQLVANFGEIRANHWHMGLDIRTQQRTNLPVYAAADGYIERVSVEPGGFGQAIYIHHPNGYTTVYGHLNAFFPALAAYVKKQQYAQESWNVNLLLPPNLFIVKKGTQIALSGSTGASEGPHVHFEIRDSKTENCLNPLLFHFPIADAVPPTLLRLALYDRNKSTYEQKPQILALKKSGSVYTTTPASVRVGSDKISFAVGAVDKFSGSTNPNGIFSARISMDGNPVSEFVLDDISYNDTRYINAQLDYPLKTKVGTSVQHLSPLPGFPDLIYKVFNEDGLVHLTDQDPHTILIQVRDANGNTSTVRFLLQYDKSLAKPYSGSNGKKFLPNNVNIFEEENFELFTTESTIYDTVTVTYHSTANGALHAVSPVFDFLTAPIPSHDSVTVRIRPTETIPEEWRDRVVIKNVCGSRTYVEKAEWQNGFYTARFRQFGSYQAFIDNEAPTVASPATNLSKATRLIFTPRDNFNTIKSFRAEVDGQWLRFSNDKGRTWVYYFDEYFPRGEHELKLTVEDEAGNVMTKTWTVKR